jgi:YVTN family beta-propeller protein
LATVVSTLHTQFIDRLHWVFLATIAPLVVGFSLITPPMQAPDEWAHYTNFNSQTVSVIARPGNAVVATIPVGFEPVGVAVTPDGKRAYFTNSGRRGGSNHVSVIDTATNTVVGLPITVGAVPQRPAVTPDGTHVYVANNYDNTVSVIRTAFNAVVKTVPVGAFPVGVAVTPDGTKVYVANNGSNNVSVIPTVPMRPQRALLR